MRPRTLPPSPPTLPPVALSLRPPWAWFAIHAPPRFRKGVENRTWKTTYRGPLWVHSSGTLTRDDYSAACGVAYTLKFPREQWPTWGDCERIRGGIIGRVVLSGVVEECASQWFEGPYGFLFERAEPVEFVRCLGACGVFPLKPETLALLSEKKL